MVSPARAGILAPFQKKQIESLPPAGARFEAKIIRTPQFLCPHQ
jgi:hypothetical protein